MTGATITVVGMPACDSRRNVSSRRDGVAARGSMVRASSGSSVVTDSATFASLRSAMRARMSMSRSDQRRLGHDADRMAGALQHFQNAAHHLILPLDRLVWIGIGADRDHASARNSGAASSFSSSSAASGFTNSLDSKSSPGDRPR